jgi:hypothetical protein
MLSYPQAQMAEELSVVAEVVAPYINCVGADHQKVISENQRLSMAAQRNR